MSTFPARIHILESPSPQDFLSNTQEGRALYETLRIGEIDVRVHTTITKATFQTVIAQIIQEAAQEDHFPILHISAHGNEDGIAFSDQSGFLPWKELGNVILPLHNELGGHLLICLSTCFGGSGFKMSCRIGQHSFHTLVGANTTVNWNDSLIAFSSFYHNFICKNIDIPSAIVAMNSAAGLANDTFQMISGEDVHKNYTKGIISHLVQRFGTKPVNKS